MKINKDITETKDYEILHKQFAELQDYIYRVLTIKENDYKALRNEINIISKEHRKIFKKITFVATALLALSFFNIFWAAIH